MSAAALFEFDTDVEPGSVFTGLAHIWLDERRGRHLTLWNNHDPALVYQGASEAPSAAGWVNFLKDEVTAMLPGLLGRLAEAHPELEIDPTAGGESEGVAVELDAARPWSCILDWYLGPEDLPALRRVAEYLLEISSGAVLYYRDPTAFTETYAGGFPPSPPEPIRPESLGEFPPEMQAVADRFVLRPAGE